MDFNQTRKQEFQMGSKRTCRLHERFKRTCKKHESTISTISDVEFHAAQMLGRWHTFQGCAGARDEPTRTCCGPLPSWPLKLKHWKR